MKKQKKKEEKARLLAEQLLNPIQHAQLPDQINSTQLFQQPQRTSQLLPNPAQQFQQSQQLRQPLPNPISYVPIQQQYKPVQQQLIHPLTEKVKAAQQQNDVTINQSLKILSDKVDALINQQPGSSRSRIEQAKIRNDKLIQAAREQTSINETGKTVPSFWNKPNLPSCSRLHVSQGGNLNFCYSYLLMMINLNAFFLQ